MVSRSRRRSKSPNIPIPFPSTPEVVTKSKNRMLGVDLDQPQPSRQQPTKFRSTAEQIHSYQRSTPSRFRSRPHLPSKPNSVFPRQLLRAVPVGKELGAKPKSVKAILPPKMSSVRSIPKKATVVEALAESAKTKFGHHQRRLPSSEAVRDSATR